MTMLPDRQRALRNYISEQFRHGMHVLDLEIDVQRSGQVIILHGVSCFVNKWSRKLLQNSLFPVAAFAGKEAMEVQYGEVRG